MDTSIQKITSREILSAGAFPTIETTITLENGIKGKASVPFGSSAGEHEAAVIQDKDPDRYHGTGMLTAVKNVEDIIAPELVGMDINDQRSIDSKLNELDDSSQKTKLGGNSVLSVSLAAVRTASIAMSRPLYRQIIQSYELEPNITSLPKPMMVLIEGGAHAHDSTDFQEYLITVDMDVDTKDRVRAGIEVYRSLAKILQDAGYSTNVGLEGAYAPSGIDTNAAPFEYFVQAIKDANYQPGKDINIAIDAAASEFYGDEKYKLKVEDKVLTSDELLDYYIRLVQKYPLISIEDPYDEDDWNAWKKFYERFANEILVVGDDLTVSQLSRLKQAADEKTINSMIIKPNQAGTLSEIMNTVNYAKENDYKLIVSHRGGGETTDTFIADLGAAIQAEYIKTGPSRGERVVKYNRLMQIADELEL